MLGLLTQTSLDGELLNRMEKRPGEILSDRVSLPPWRQLWHTWRNARQAGRT